MPAFHDLKSIRLIGLRLALPMLVFAALLLEGPALHNAGKALLHCCGSEPLASVHGRALSFCACR